MRISKRTGGESGHSLTEMMAAIMILSIAIIPMVGMFDMGLRSAGTSSDYDRARSLANLKLEEAKSLPYDTASNSTKDLRDAFPNAAGTSTPYDGSGHYRSAYVGAEADLGTDFAGLEYMVEKQFLAQPDPATASQAFDESPTDEGLIRITVTVRWDDGDTYGATGLAGK